VDYQLEFATEAVRKVSGAEAEMPPGPKRPAQRKSSTGPHRNRFSSRLYHHDNAERLPNRNDVLGMHSPLTCALLSRTDVRAAGGMHCRRRCRM